MWPQSISDYALVPVSSVLQLLLRTAGTFLYLIIVYLKGSHYSSVCMTPSIVASLCLISWIVFFFSDRGFHDVPTIVGVGGVTVWPVSSWPLNPNLLWSCLSHSVPLLWWGHLHPATGVPHCCHRRIGEFTIMIISHIYIWAIVIHMNVDN